MILYKFTATDQTGSMQVTIFNSKYDAAKIHQGCEYLFYGKINPDSFYIEMSAPKISSTADKRLRPIYPQTAGVSSKAIEALVKTAITSVAHDEFLPEDIILKNDLCSLDFAIKNIHFPHYLVRMPLQLHNTDREK
jgi:ATP-dependent DNA helicase RecG